MNSRAFLSTMSAFVIIFLGLCAVGCGGGSSATGGTSIDPPANEFDPPGEAPGFPFVEHLDQERITDGSVRFDELFIIGDELFEVPFTGLDGVGAQRLPDGSPLLTRFARVPPGGGRLTGPNGQSCVGCHNAPLPTSAGIASGNVAQDPSGTGQPPFNLRNTISLFGAAVLQRLAEEMSEDLHAIRDEASDAAEPGGPPITRALVSKTISYGSITASRTQDGTLTIDASSVEGVDADLVVRPYGWKGNVPTLREFVRSAARNELGMEGTELVSKNPATSPDPDGDGIEGELSVGDITALTIYVGAQEIPTTLHDLVGRGWIPPLPREQSDAIAKGGVIFVDIGCSECHVAELTMIDPVFEEPTMRGNGHYLDVETDPIETGLDPSRPFRFDLVREGDRPRLPISPSGGALVRLFGDMKRHNMGAQLADPQATVVNDANGRDLSIEGKTIFVDSQTFLTAELWGVGNTGPWLHDGRAGTLEEAIMLHGVDSPPPPIGDPQRSEAQESRDAFATLSDENKAALLEFLESLVLFALEEED